MKRREFIGKSAVAAGAITVLPGQVKAGTPSTTGPGKRINLGYIGVGKQSLGLLRSIGECPETKVLAACDVDKLKLNRFKELAEKHNSEKFTGEDKKVDAYENYRELLEREDIDAVVIATPDHWHAMIAVDAAKAGKDIYCEKPMALTVAEGQGRPLVFPQEQVWLAKCTIVKGKSLSMGRGTHSGIKVPQRLQQGGGQGMFCLG